MFRTRFASNFIATLAIVSGVSAAEPANLDGFQKKVQPFLVAHCVKCHGTEKPKGDLTLTGISGDAVGGNDLGKWATVAEKLKAGDMPPEGETQPAPEAIKAVTDWIDAELAKAGKNGALKPGSLKTGNHAPPTNCSSIRRTSSLWIAPLGFGGSARSSTKPSPRI